MDNIKINDNNSGAIARGSSFAPPCLMRDHSDKKIVNLETSLDNKLLYRSSFRLIADKETYVYARYYNSNIKMAATTYSCSDLLDGGFRVVISNI
jgi:hypothetical protein